MPVLHYFSLSSCISLSLIQCYMGSHLESSSTALAGCTHGVTDRQTDNAMLTSVAIAGIANAFRWRSVVYCVQRLACHSAYPRIAVSLMAVRFDFRFRGSQIELSTSASAVPIASEILQISPRISWLEITRYSVSYRRRL